jgi:hypothetical protein
MFFQKAQSHNQINGAVVSDLDALIAAPVPFKFNGKVHVINPISVVEFYKYINALSGIMNLNQDSVTVDEMIDKYYALFGAICDTITRNDISSMTQAQVTALFQLTVDSIMGKSQTDHYDIQKKN